MQNPFESGHIRNYILFYVGVVFIIILFFFASSLFNDVAVVEKKVFNTTIKKSVTQEKENSVQKEKSNPFELKLLKKAY